MMSINLYDTSILPIIRTLKNLSNILKKSQAWADEKGIPHADLLGARLAPDMHPLTFQVQTASNTAKFLAVRVAGVPNLPMDDNEKTFEELEARLLKTVDFLEAVKREDFDGKDTTAVVYRDINFTGLTYINGFALPNFYFHAMATYSILRMKGVDLGKMDWLGRSQ